jgi:hypothetical protein
VPLGENTTELGLVEPEGSTYDVPPDTTPLPFTANIVTSFEPSLAVAT